MLSPPSIASVARTDPEVNALAPRDNRSDLGNGPHWPMFPDDVPGHLGLLKEPIAKAPCETFGIDLDQWRGFNDINVVDDIVHLIGREDDVRHCLVR